MDSLVKIKENWLTQKPNEMALFSTLVFSIFVSALSYFYLNDLFQTTELMPASRESVFKNQEYWRLWSTLFAHADLEHLLSNLILLIPLSFLLSGYFGFFVFPSVGIVMGGLINYIVLQGMPFSVRLIGISGLVYWMGAVWLTLYFLIDRRKPLRVRLAICVFLTVVLFLPESYRPEVSYYSHFVGYFLGILFGLVYYLYRRRLFKSFEVIQPKTEDLELSELDKEALSLKSL